MGGRTDEQMLSRIGFAERWLARAKRQWVEGHRARSVLTLVLANAEVRHAMETAGVSGRARVRRPAAAAVLLLATMVAAVLVLIGRWPVSRELVATTPPPLVVRPPSTSGALVDVMRRPPLPVTTAPSVPAVTRVAVPPVPAPRMPEPLEVSRPVLPTLISHRPAVSGSPSSASMPNLLDLVLTAERVLRRGPALPPSP
jgi:hypothetical protein